jgi:hypothetical protein
VSKHYDYSEQAKEIDAIRIKHEPGDFISVWAPDCDFSIYLSIEQARAFGIKLLIASEPQ